MAISFELDAARRRVHATVTGMVTLPDIIATLDGVLAMPEFGPEFKVLSDHRGVEQPASVQDAEDMLAYMRASRERFQNMRWAVVTHRPSSYALMGLVSTLADLRVQMVVRVFTRMDEAERWLDEA